jgi:hypothetical protein
MKKFVDLNLFKKIGLIRKDCLFLINMFKVLSISNVRLFFNIFSHVHVSIFHGLVTG